MQRRPLSQRAWSKKTDGTNSLQEARENACGSSPSHLRSLGARVIAFREQWMPVRWSSVTARNCQRSFHGNARKCMEAPDAYNLPSRNMCFVAKNTPINNFSSQQRRPSSYMYLSGPSGAAIISSSPTVRASSPSRRHRWRVHATGSSSSPLLKTTIFVFSIAASCGQDRKILVGNVAARCSPDRQKRVPFQPFSGTQTRLYSIEYKNS